MAKKTSYLTELIDRHERWKAEGGERPEEETQDGLEDLSKRFFSLIYKSLWAFDL
jgi:serine/threonine-protein kinase 24/25/MST4